MIQGGMPLAFGLSRNAVHGTSGGGLASCRELKAAFGTVRVTQMDEDEDNEGP